MDQQDVQKLYCAHHHWMKSLLAGKLQCVDDAADLAQDAFERLLKKDLRFDSLSGGRHYLSRIAHALCIDFWRRRKIEQAYLESLQHLSEPYSADLTQHQIVIDIIVKADRMLCRLPGKIKRTFIAVQIEGLTYNQVAERDNISVASVKNYLAQAILRMTMFREAFDLD
ncbi:sigma-70 family RNA polymerase sigma factor [Rheinheimera muenzenbergensis]|uniref:Sigma-70 family RNA polymerase sigma factor n=1 Tax=Rheinheimera muenzenbergensis TaxID=1193628 RepID=A0ABU8C364_9GAMM